MPPMRPAKTTRSSWWAWSGFMRSNLSRSTTPLATVVATSTDRNAPTRLSEAEMPTATLGLSAPVAMDVAIALPVSWKPLV